MSLLRLYTGLGRLGLIAGSSGNVSERTADGMLITPTGGSPGGAGKGDLAKTTLDGARLNAAAPSSEWQMHAAIYKTFPGAGCVVHTHADACTALAVLGLDLPPFHYLVVQFGGATVRCAPYAAFGTQALADRAIDALRDRTACLLANHGMILYARDADQALARTQLLETLCRQYLLARSSGKPRLLTAGDIAAAKERFKTYGPAAALPPA